MRKEKIQFSETGVAKQLKVLIRECTKEREILEKPLYRNVNNPHDKERDDLAIELTQLLLDTTYFNLVTKVYISDFFMSKVDAANELRKLGFDMIQSTANSRIRSDMLKFCRDFGTTIIVDLFENTSASVSRYQFKLSELEASKYRQKCELDDLIAIELPTGIKFQGEEISDDDLQSFMNTIIPYSKGVVELTQRSLDRKVCGYVRWLYTADKSELNENEREHLAIINETLNKKFI